MNKKLINSLIGLLLLLLANGVMALETLPAIGHETVEEAYEALKIDQNAKASEYEGWYLFTTSHDGVYSIWSFTPPEHPAHPSVIKRDIVKKDKKLYINMNALCEAVELNCDLLIESFKQINEEIKARHESS